GGGGGGGGGGPRGGPSGFSCAPGPPDAPDARPVSRNPQARLPARRTGMTCRASQAPGDDPRASAARPWRGAAATDKAGRQQAIATAIVTVPDQPRPGAAYSRPIGQQLGYQGGYRYGARLTDLRGEADLGNARTCRIADVAWAHADGMAARRIWRLRSEEIDLLSEKGPATVPGQSRRSRLNQAVGANLDVSR